MKYTDLLKNEQGIALVTALVLGLLGMLMISALLVMVQTGVWFMGSQKRYQVILDGSHGGLNFFAKEVINQGLGGQNLSSMGAYGGLLTAVIADNDFSDKLSTTGDYPAQDIDVTITYALPSGPNVTVNSAILSTSRGNSGTSSNILGGGGVVNNTSGQVIPMHIPYIYQIETRGSTTANENVRLSSIYAY